MITFETKSGLKIRVSGRSVTDVHTRLIKFLKDLRKLLNDEDYYMQRYAGLIRKLLEKYEIDLDAI